MRTGCVAIAYVLEFAGAAHGQTAPLICATLPSAPGPFPAPEHPAASKRACDEGRVVVGVCIDAAGRATSAELLSSSGKRRLDDSTMKWACRKDYKPLTGADGAPIASCNVAIDYTWHLRDYPRWRSYTSHSEPVADHCASVLGPDFVYEDDR